MTTARINVISATQTEKYRILLCFDEYTEKEYLYRNRIEHNRQPLDAFA